MSNASTAHDLQPDQPGEPDRPDRPDRTDRTDRPDRPEPRDPRGPDGRGRRRRPGNGSGPLRIEGEHFDAEDFFGLQRTSGEQLPDPLPLLENLSRCVIEVLAGARELDQLARWVTDDVYRHLLKRVVLAARARAVKGTPVRRPQLTIGHTLLCRPCDDVVEAVVVVHGRARTRAVAIRLEGLDSRWRASAVSVL